MTHETSWLFLLELITWTRFKGSTKKQVLNNLQWWAKLGTLQRKMVEEGPLIFLNVVTMCYHCNEVICFCFGGKDFSGFWFCQSVPTKFPSSSQKCLQQVRNVFPKKFFIAPRIMSYPWSKEVGERDFSSVLNVFHWSSQRVLIGFPRCPQDVPQIYPTCFGHSSTFMYRKAIGKNVFGTILGGAGQRGTSLVGTAQYPRKIGEGPINVAPSEGKKTMENTPLNCG